MTAYWQLLRPRQWTKNIFIFAGLIFSRQFLDVRNILITFFAFILFSMLSSGVYILNDITDYEEDRIHPTKSQRPIARGAIKRNSALPISLFLLIAGLASGFFINSLFVMVCSIYAIIMIVYSLWIKQIVILDILFVAAGYVLRAVAGAVAIKVAISSWLLLCTLLIALFLVLSKRRTEVLTLGEAAEKHRRILTQYPVSMLDQMIAIVSSACIVSYCLYTLAADTVAKFNTRNLIFTVPFVIYGIFRYLYITHKIPDADSTEKIMLTDIPLQVCLFLWVLSCIVILINY